MNFAACPDKLACPQGFLSFVLSEDMSLKSPGQMKLSARSSMMVVGMNYRPVDATDDISP
jgi:hypothetical protein